MDTRERRSRRGGAITLHDVAEVAGVSPMTASRVLAGQQSVNDDMRRRVLDAAKRVGYSLNPAARALARAKHSKIGILSGNPSAIFTSQLLVSLFEYSTQMGLQLVLSKATPRGDRGGAVLIDANVSGVILPTPLCDDNNLHRLFNDAGIFTVALGTGCPDSPGLSVGIDNEKAATKMAEYLLSLGHRDIAFIQGPANHIDSEQRLRGFLNAMQSAGLNPPSRMIARGDYSYRSGLSAAEALLAIRKRPTAIFASNDEMAAGVLAAAHRKGLSVPEQLGIAGFDDTPLATTVWPTLTTIRQPVDVIAKQAIDLLISAARDGLDPKSVERRRVLVPLTLIKRESVLPY